MRRGLFITFEGIEGSGKSTQAARLVAHLRERGLPATMTHEPGGTDVGRRIRELFLNPKLALEPPAELFLVLADRAQHVGEKLKPELARGTIVVSDRYCDSTIAYQGYGRGFDLAVLADLNRLAGNGLMPDLTIVLDCSVRVGLARVRNRAPGGWVPDRFERETVEFHEKVRAGFIAIARNEPARVKLIDAERAPEQVGAEVLGMVEQLLVERWH